MSNGSSFARARSPACSLERRPASRCVINSSGRGRERFVGRAFARTREVRGARKSIFARLDRRRFVRHVGGERRAAGNRAIWCAPGCGGPMHSPCPAARGGCVLNPLRRERERERRARTLRPVPAKDPRAPGPLNIDTGGTKTPRRPSPSSLPARDLEGA